MKGVLTVFVFFVSGITAIAQVLEVSGDVRCKYKNNRSVGLSDILVAPGFQPRQSTVTASQPAGYYFINTEVDIKYFIDKQLVLYILPTCPNCKAQTIRKYIWKDNIKTTGDGRLLCILNPIYLKMNCDSVSINSYSADSLLNVLKKIGKQDLNKEIGKGAYVVSPAFLQILSTLSIALAGPEDTTSAVKSYKLKKITSNQMKPGRFLWNSAMDISTNLGNNFSPLRDYSEAPFWNPSAIGLQYNSASVSLFVNWTSHFKVSGFAKVGKLLFISGGILHIAQREELPLSYVNIDTNNPTSTGRISMVKLRETALFLSPILKLNNHFSIGMTLKPIWQNILIPDILIITQKLNDEYQYSKIKNNKMDFDFSASYNYKNIFGVGINVMNLQNTRLFSQIKVSDSTLADFSSRSLGVGLTFRKRNVNLGADLLLANKRWDVSYGGNYLFLRKCKINIGYNLMSHSSLIGFAYNGFKIAYVNTRANIFSTNYLHGLYSSCTINF